LPTSETGDRAAVLAPPVVGIFVGGRSTRMGGVPKGTLRAPDGTATLVQRLVHVSRAVHAERDVVLVGQTAGYEGLGLSCLVDRPPGIGPLGGLLALLAYTLAQRGSYAVALACDLPFVTEELLARLVRHLPEAAAVAPRPDGLWQPLCARYTPGPVSAAADAALRAGEYALQQVFRRLSPHVAELPLTADEHRLIRDWDSPDDMSPQ
jgi:molybdopterin-guanine dinucleotide biosynthesis protein A